MEQSNNTGVYPGMVNAETEVFNHGDSLLAIHGGRTISFDELPLEVFKKINDILNTDHAAQLQLSKWHPGNPKAQLKKFASCRFGGLDHTPDFGESMQCGEYWECPQRGKCDGEGVVCKMPIYKNVRLTSNDVKLIKLLTTVSTNDVIAQQLCMALGSFHLAKKKLYQKLGVMTKQEITRVAVALNIIQPHIIC
jgi:hypothetical protein